MTDHKPTAVEVIAEALIDARCHPDCWLTTSNGDPACSDCSAAAALAALKAAGFVVATRDEIRAMTPQEQAELIGGEVQRYPVTLPNGAMGRVDLVTGPWRSTKPPHPEVQPPWREVQP